MLLLLLASFALVALIGAALVYAVNRLVTWTVDRVEARQVVVSPEAPATETPTQAVPAPAPVTSSSPAATAATELPTAVAPDVAVRVEPQAGPASSAA